jgi:hypothetical protein|tara:strand:+ start:17956 stop:18240 length:285 start_codon:yes stop_codon:yes gene_type:complete
MIIDWIAAVFGRKIVKKKDWERVVVRLDKLQSEIKEVNTVLDRQTDIIGIVAGVQSELMLGLQDPYGSQYEDDDGSTQKIIIPLNVPPDDDFMN